MKSRTMRRIAALAVAACVITGLATLKATSGRKR